MSSYYEKILATGEVKCIDEEVPFEIPQGWEWCRVSAVSCSIVDGDHMPPPKSFQGIPFIVISNITMGYLDLNTSRYVPESYFRTLSQERVPQVGDILFSVTGSYGIAVRINTNCKFCFQRHIALIRPMSINSEYLEFLLNSAFIKKQCDTIATGMAQKTVGIDSLRELIIPIPPIQEQGSIVAKLKLLMPLVRKYSIMQEKLDRLDANIKDRLYNSILQDAIKGWPTCPKLYKFCHRDSRDNAIVLLEQIKTEKQKLVKEGKLKKSALNDSIIFRGDDNRYYEKIGKKCVDITEQISFDLPDSWSWARGKSVFMPMESTKPSSDFVYIDVDAVNNRLNIIDKPKKVRIENAPSRATRKLHKNDLLFSMVRPYLKNIALVDDIYKDAIASTGFYVITPSLGYYPMFLYYLMLSNYVVDGLNSFMKGDNSPSINNCHIENYLYPLPPIEEQQRIVEKIEHLMQLLK